MKLVGNNNETVGRKCGNGSCEGRLGSREKQFYEAARAQLSSKEASHASSRNSPQRGRRERKRMSGVKWWWDPK